LALLKDTGWYDVDYDNADKFFFAKDEGCGFLNDHVFIQILNNFAAHIKRLALKL